MLMGKYLLMPYTQVTEKEIMCCFCMMLEFWPTECNMVAIDIRAIKA